MRKKIGDIIILFNQQCGEWLASITSLNNENKVTAVALSQKSQRKEEYKKISLYFAPIKTQTAAFLTEKATELGVNSIHPIITERTIVRKVNIKKMEIAAISAAEQSGRISIPSISDTISFQKALENATISNKDTDSSVNIFLSSQHQNMRISGQKILSFLNDLSNFEKYNLFIGPEGGFSEGEISAIESCVEQNIKRNKILSIGHNILRAETALISAMALFYTTHQ
jgi:16S rRNA (uracil1498-N3)-methyltransferase